MPDFERELNIQKQLFRKTVDGNLSWRMHREGRRYDRPVETLIGQKWKVVVEKDGTIIIDNFNAKYLVEGPMGRDVYKAARRSAWKGSDYEDALEDFEQKLNDHGS
jgi:hypothetical protein